MRSNKKPENVADTSFKKIPASSSFDSVMKATKKPKASSIDRNMLFVSYLMERQMSDRLESRQKKTLSKSEGRVSYKNR